MQLLRQTANPSRSLRVRERDFAGHSPRRVAPRQLMAIGDVLPSPDLLHRPQGSCGAKAQSSRRKSQSRVTSTRFPPHNHLIRPYLCAAMPHSSRRNARISSDETIADMAAISGSTTAGDIDTSDEDTEFSYQVDMRIRNGGNDQDHEHVGAAACDALHEGEGLPSKEAHLATSIAANGHALDDKLSVKQHPETSRTSSDPIPGSPDMATSGESRSGHVSSNWDDPSSRERHVITQAGSANSTDRPAMSQLDISKQPDATLNADSDASAPPLDSSATPSQKLWRRIKFGALVGVVGIGGLVIGREAFALIFSLLMLLGTGEYFGLVTKQCELKGTVAPTRRSIYTSCWACAAMPLITS